jgi:hypothetical protein
MLNNKQTRNQHKTTAKQPRQQQQAKSCSDSRSKTPESFRRIFGFLKNHPSN